MSRTGGAYVNGRYVPAGKAAKGGGRGGGKGEARSFGGGDDGERFERKPGDEDTNLERKFDIDILQPGESRVGYLFNMKPSRHYDEMGRHLSAMLLFFLQRDGRTFRATFTFRPYFFVQLGERENFEKMADILTQRFNDQGVFVEIVEREDLAMEDHLIGRKRKLIKLSFENSDGLLRARKDLQIEMRRSQKKKEGFSFDAPEKSDKGSAIDAIVDMYEYDVAYVNRVCIDNGINCGKWFQVTRNTLATSADDIWDTQCKVVALNDMLAKPGLRIFAWDIECTKEPLKFPDAAYDRITMISAMVDGSGFLLVNRSEVAADIEPLEYTPKPEYEGIFDTYNEEDEAALLKRFFKLLRDTCPHVTVTFNGDFFDFPFVQKRAMAHNLDWAVECGIKKAEDADYYAGTWLVHLDCFCWVQRDSYLPCGARGLKAVTRYKLKYDPVELDPEDMTPFCKDRPQELAAYSVSDAVATYYLYMKYIHDFIFALCSIIPYGPDDVLRKGSGTLCESLLMNQAFHANVLFPNKHIDPPIEFHEATNRMVETSTYEGARVECMRVGVYRADIPETFQLEPSAFQTLIDDLKRTVDFFLVVEEKVKIEDVENYEEILALIEKQLRDLCDPPQVAAQVGRELATSPSKSGSQQSGPYKLKLVEYEFVEGAGGVKDANAKKVKRATHRVIKDDLPMIYHLDVGAMYPNIILSNRLQPSAIVDPEFCTACTYNDPANKCQRRMDWRWRGDLYMATRADVKSIMNEMENESRRYLTKDRDGEQKRVTWKELGEKDQTAEIVKAVRQFSQKAYSRLKSSVYEQRNDIVCQRENPFYVDTVLNFRDRRYTFKRKTKESAKMLEKAEEAGDAVKMQEAKDLVLLYDSLQLAHKCILNSFYGYVMRKGARWHSMRMAGIVTYTGSNLIREAREFCEMVGLPIELDTDGIWCMLPKSFPDTFKFKLKNGKDIKMPYPNCVLNYRVHEKYTNHQYQQRGEKGDWQMRSENSIFFEIDGPYKAMILPASTVEDKMLKKRYAVFNFDGSLAELKGFEVKRRGELRLIQVFQEEVFPEFLKGTTREEVYAIVGAMANRWLDVIESKGRTMTDDEVIYFFSENKSMSKSVEASGNHKSVQITTAKRLAEFLGVDSILKSEGVSCHMLIANKPVGASCTERAIPVKIFNAEFEVKKRFLRQWLQDPCLNDFDMRSIIDWEYYKERLVAVFQKLISIPAAYQRMPNPCPRVKVPDWLKKRVTEQTDRFQQRSLGMWFRKTGDGQKDGGFGEVEKRKLCDLEDLAGPAGNAAAPQTIDAELAKLPIVEFGAGPKKWVEVQRERWSLDRRRAQREKRTSLFDNGGAAWAQISPEVLRNVWHIVSVEAYSATQSGMTLRTGDAVTVKLDDADDFAAMQDVEPTPEKATVVGFVGGLVRVALESGDEQLVPRSSVTPLQEDGLFVLWVASEPDLVLHRVEVFAKRRIVLALDGDFSPDDARREVRPADLVKGLTVWPKDEYRQSLGPGTVTSAAPEVGVCGVTWANDMSEVAFAADLEQRCGAAARVVRDPPRNMHHRCLVELELDENDFQRQRTEGALGDAEANFPRVGAVYEAEQPLVFDLLSRLGSVVRLAAPDRTEERKGRCLRMAPGDFLPGGASSTYLRGFTPTRNIYMFFCFDQARNSRSFCGIFAPALAEVRVCFSGLNAAEGERMRPDLEHMISSELGATLIGEDVATSLVQVQVYFNPIKSLTSLVQWSDRTLQDLRRRDDGSICVLCSQLSTGELRGLSASCWVEQRHLRNLTALREMPSCRAPFAESDAHFPALDWCSWACRRFTGKVPQLFAWWRQQLHLCRSAGLPIGNAPELPAATVPTALDLLFSRHLQKESQLRWASPTCRPDLGEVSLSLTDAQEGSVDTMNWLLLGKDLTQGRGNGQINKPGTYRSVCLEVDLRTKLCICAMQHARSLSDMEGGELSRKNIRKQQAAAGEAAARNMDHTSEASVTSLESLVDMVQAIAASMEAREKDILELRNRWLTMAAQGANQKVEEFAAAWGLARIPTNDDEAFVEAMSNAGYENQALASRLADLKAEHGSQEALLEGLYGWLSSPTSLFFDCALVRRVQQYMDKVLQLFVSVLKKNGCSVIHASYGKVLFATGKLRIVPDIGHFWEALIDNVRSHKALEPLRLSDMSCLSELYYGMMWLDPANWAGLGVDTLGEVTGTPGGIIWKATSKWKMFEFLPAAIRPSLNLYACELLAGPQRELHRRVTAPNAANLAKEAATAAEGGVPMEVDGGEPGAGGEDGNESDGEGDGDCGAPAPCGNDEPAAAEPDKAAPAVNEKALSLDVAAKHAEILEELQTYIQTDFFPEMRRRVLEYFDVLQAQLSRERGIVDRAAGSRSRSTIWHQMQGETEENTLEVGLDDEDNEGLAMKRASEDPSYIQEKWTFPEVPGRRAAPGSPDLELMKALVQVFQLEECLGEQVTGLRDKLCQKLRISSFTKGLEFESPCFPLVLRDVVCRRCCSASHVDVTSHESRGPGLWVCQHCGQLYEKDALQAQLVSTLEAVVQAWQAQELQCKKCRRLKTSNILVYCDCFGKFQTKFSLEDCRLVLRIMRSLVEPHDLHWLGEMLDSYEMIVQ